MERGPAGDHRECAVLPGLDPMLDARRLDMDWTLDT